jgi:putative ABC transport system ATP-binding protein
MPIRTRRSDSRCKIAKEHNVAIIMVTHDARLLPYCDKILSIEKRKIVTKT